MRPIERGPSPTLPFNIYREAFEPLSNKLGCYCNYCERRLPTNLAIEHVQPKSKNKALELEWTNFLLACCNCNSSKGDVAINLIDYVWPDTHNTLTAFSYANGAIKNVLKTSHPAYLKVEALILLTGLDKDPGHPNKNRRPENTDLRWKDRFDLWEKATKSKERLAKDDSLGMREEIVESALGWGGFGIWFEVFKNDVDMCVRLIRAFPGTAPDCFDNHLPVCRPKEIL